MRTFPSVLPVLSAVLLCALAFSSAAVAQHRPRNILILYSDDHSYHALGAAGNREVLTPNLDRLAAGGMRFTQAHVMGGHQGAVCIPSRAMLLTGRYVNRLPGDGSTIPADFRSLPEVLRAAGYTTYHTGKWHSDRASHHRMFSAGGDVFFGGMHFPRDGGQAHPTVYAFDPGGVWPESLRRRADTFSSTLYADNAIRFLSGPEARERPFLCYVAFTSPHDPRTPPARWAARYDPARITLPGNFLPRHPFDNGDLQVRDEQLLPRPLHPDTARKDIAAYYAMISEMDEQVGRILDALRDSGLADSTLVVFAGDNGLAMGRHGLLGKQNLYEHSIRVPMVMAGPGIPGGTRYDGFIYLSDIAPTLLDILGLPRPASFEALSHAAVLTRPERQLRDRIYNVYGSWSRSVKTADGLKLILYNVDGVRHEQLFDLASDPLETRNLAQDPAFAGRKARLLALLKAEMRDLHDDLDLDAADWGRARAGRRGRGS
jgi:arylsulfatase A-like enzyme